MDNTGGDLAHAAKAEEEAIEVDEAYREQSEENGEKKSDSPTPDADQSRHDAIQEKDVEHRAISSSGSSSEDVKELQKYDSQIVKVKDVKEGDEAYAHLPEHEREIIKRQLDLPPITASFATLYRYATRNDIIITVISAICAIIGGAVMPLMTVSGIGTAIRQDLSDQSI